MSEDYVLYEADEGLARITLNRPEKLNAINAAMGSQLRRALLSAANANTVNVVLIRAEGRAFSAGRDMQEMSSAEQWGRGRSRSGAGEGGLYSLLYRYAKPVVSAVQGYALANGAALALLSDIVIAGEGAQFGWPQTRLGTVSISGPAILAHLIPLRFASELLLTGRMVGASEALRMGIVNRVVPDEQLHGEAETVARQICANASLAVQAMKESIRRAQALTFDDRLAMADYFMTRAKQTRDAQEGLDSFKQKRRPSYAGE